MSLITERIHGPLTEYLVTLQVFGHSPVTVIDVGASGGLAQLLQAFGNQWTGIGFEPLVKECERLQRDAPPHLQYVPAFVTGPPDSEPRDRDHGTLQTKDWSYFRSSSVRAQKLQHVDYARAKFNSGEELVYTNGRTTLDQFLDTYPCTPNFLKVDTDGSDYDVLRGAANLLASPQLFGVLIESQFQGDFQSDRANVFANIDRFLRAKGFQLVDLSTWRYSRAVLPSKFVYDIPAQTLRGPVLWGDALFFRDYGHPEYERLTGYKIDITDVLKLAAILEMYDLEDCSAELLIKYGDRLPASLQLDTLLNLVTPAMGEHKMTYGQFNQYFEKNIGEFYPRSSEQSKPTESSGQTVFKRWLRRFRMRLKW